MITRNIIKSLPKDEVKRLIKRWHHLRHSNCTKAAAEKRVGYSVEKMTRWAKSHNLEFKS